jgi:hypothetical protein
MAFAHRKVEGRIGVQNNTRAATLTFRVIKLSDIFERFHDVLLCMSSILIKKLSASHKVPPPRPLLVL